MHSSLRPPRLDLVSVSGLQGVQGVRQTARAAVMRTTHGLVLGLGLLLCRNTAILQRLGEEVSLLLGGRLSVGRLGRLLRVGTRWHGRTPSTPSTTSTPRSAGAHLCGPREALGPQACVCDRLEELLDVGGHTHESILPQLVPWVSDEFDEGDEEAPGVRTVHYQTLQQHPGDLFLYDLLFALCEEVEQHAAEVVRVGVGVSQLVGDGREEEVAAVHVELLGEVGEDLQGRVVRVGAALLHVVRQIDHESVEDRDVISGLPLLGLIKGPQVQLPTQLNQKPTLPSPEKAVDVLFDAVVAEDCLVVAEYLGCVFDLLEEVDLEVGHEGVGELHLPREGRQDEVAHLDAVLRDDVAQGEVVLAQKLGVVVQHYQQHTKRSLVKLLDGFGELHFPQVGLHEVEVLQ
mmetsp:Transcript_3880/g.9769  ORF Transcript_3880/g.9769 Transcript_3880/m.9769 type:complete len:403 (-) Transcript_3880:512-1720(-)